MDSVELRRPLRILLSYHYFKDENIRDLLAECFAGVPIDVFADSGAYSAWTGGQPITVAEYLEWLREWGDCFTCAAALDVIGDAKASWRQTEEMREALGNAIDLVPVFHSNDGDGWAWLERYQDAGYTYIGISPTGAIYTNQKLWRGWTEECFRRRREGIRYHGFGVTAWRIMRDFPWYSVDSSSWASCFRFARLILFHCGKLVTINMRDRRDLMRNAPVLRSYGLSPATAHADHYDRWQLVRVCVEAWQRAEEWLARSPAYQGNARVYMGMHTNQSAEGNRKNIRAMSGPLARDPRVYMAIERGATTGTTNASVRQMRDALAGPRAYMALGIQSNTNPQAVGEAVRSDDGSPRIYLTDDDKE